MKSPYFGIAFCLLFLICSTTPLIIYILSTSIMDTDPNEYLRKHDDVKLRKPPRTEVHVVF